MSSSTDDDRATNYHVPQIVCFVQVHNDEVSNNTPFLHTKGVVSTAAPLFLATLLLLMIYFLGCVISVCKFTQPSANFTDQVSAVRYSGSRSSHVRDAYPSIHLVREHP